jgi:hypothetical protein
MVTNSALSWTGEVALDDEQAVEKVVARMHAHGLGLDDGTQVKATKAGQQFGDGLTDVQGVEIDPMLQR